jgi:PTS system glucitol/sorbitol-specific IIA component
MSETTATTRVVYESTVTAVGDQVQAFLDHGLLIFFADSAPEELHDMSVRHTASVAEEGPQEGDTIVLGDRSMEVLAVGPVVGENLLNLGHIDIKANGQTKAKLPGDANVAKQDLPLPTPGDVFRIIRGNRSDTEEPR